MTGERSCYLEFALQLAAMATTEIMPRFRVVSVQTKEDGSEVTAADRQAEAVMRGRIQTRYPEHGVLGEEGGLTNPDAEYQWILDPIDGTLWFTLGVPKFGTLIALLRDREPILGVVHLPATDETLFAEVGCGCWYRHAEADPKEVAVQGGVKSLNAAFVSAAGVHHSEISPCPGPGPYRLTTVIRRARKFRFVGDCVQHMLVARGMLHAALDPMMQPWDSAALVPCIREAGGCVSTMDGGTDDVVFGQSLITSCSPELHAELIEHLNS